LSFIVIQKFLSLLDNNKADIEAVQKTSQTTLNTVKDLSKVVEENRQEAIADVTRVAEDLVQTQESVKALAFLGLMHLSKLLQKT
jgi:DNA-binding protein H-NS